MEEKKCLCGGTMRSLGLRELRMGPTVYANGSLEIEMFVCDHCHELKLYLPEVEFQKLACTPEERYLRKFADYSEVELRRIAESHYQPEARRATAALLDQQKGTE